MWPPPELNHIIISTWSVSSCRNTSWRLKLKACWFLSSVFPDELIVIEVSSWAAYQHTGGFRVCRLRPALRGKAPTKSRVFFTQCFSCPGSDIQICTGHQRVSLLQMETCKQALGERESFELLRYLSYVSKMPNERNLSVVIRIYFSPPVANTAWGGWLRRKYLIPIEGNAL